MEKHGRTRAGVEKAPEASGPLRQDLRPRGPIRFEVDIDEKPKAIWLRIRGELDVLTTPRLASELNTLVRRFKQDVVIDLRQAQFIDSAGLQILLGIQRRLSQGGRGLTVICDEGAVRRVIEMTRLGDILGLVSGAEASDG